MLILTLDDNHLGDPMFAGRLARAAAKRTVPLVVVHDSGEGGGRALEALGQRVERNENGIWAARTDQERHIVERAARDLNRKLVSELNENGVPAVRITGLDRGLLSMNHEGTVHCRGSEWVQSIAEQGTVPVIAGLAETTDGIVVEVSAGRVAVAISASKGEIGVLRRKTGEKSKEPLYPLDDSTIQVVKGSLIELLTNTNR